MQDLSNENPHSKAFRQMLSEPLFSVNVAISSANEDYSIDQKVNEYFDYLENLFVDQADGLVPTDEATNEIQEMIKEYNAIKATVAKLRPHLTAMSKQLASSSTELGAFRDLLDSDLASVMTISRIGTPALDVDSALENWFGGWLTEVEGGRLSVPEDQQEDITNSTVSGCAICDLSAAKVWISSSSQADRASKSIRRLSDYRRQMPGDARIAGSAKSSVLRRFWCMDRREF